MSIRKLRAGRVPSVTAEQYIGEYGALFWNESTGELRLSNGSTAGGLPVAVAYATSTTAGSVKPGAGFNIGAGGALTLNAGSMFELDDNNVFQLLPGTADRIGGIKPGPGVTIDSTGTLLIDPEGLEFTFGHLTSAVGEYTDTSEYALLSSLNANEDVVVASNGTGSVCIVGELHVHATNGSVTGSLEAEPFFQIKSDGQVRILVPIADPSEGGVEIIGNTSGLGHPPNQSGVMLHVTGNSPVDNVGQPCRNYFDSRDSYTVITGRRFNGPADSVTKVLNGETLLRVVGQASTDTGFQTFGPARVDFVATQDQAVNAQGGEVQIYATANNTAANSAVKVAAFNATTGVTATKFVGPLEGNVTGNVSGSAATVTTAAQPAITSVGTLTNLAIATGGTITTPRVVINDGGIRTVSGGTTLTIDFATDSLILWTAPSGTATVTLSNYTAGAQVKLIIALTTSRDINFGVAGVANSSTGSDNWNGAGGGAIDIANTAVHLEYTCITALAAGCYVKVTAN